MSLSVMTYNIVFYKQQNVQNYEKKVRNENYKNYTL